MERFRFQPWGLAGGQAGQQGYVVRNPENEAEKLPKIDVLRPAKGDIISITSPGGGGFGPGYLRPVDKVVAEVKDGLLSAEQAAEAYGVIFGDSAVDEKATNEARSKMEAAKNEAWDFGAFRSDYESVWTAEASAALAVALRSYPANLRNDMKRQVHRHFEVQKKPLTKQDVLDGLRQITGRKRMKRLGKYAAASVALILLLVLVSCSSGEEEKSVTIGVYGGDWEANIGEAIDSFEKETGIKVNVIAGTDAEWYMKMRAADGSNVPYDC